MAAKNDVMTVAEADERFAGKWLALEVVKRNRWQQPLKVRLIAQTRTRAQLSKKIRGIPEVYIHLAGPLFPEDGTIVLQVRTAGGQESIHESN